MVESFSGVEGKLTVVGKYLHMLSLEAISVYYGAITKKQMLTNTKYL